VPILNHSGNLKFTCTNRQSPYQHRNNGHGIPKLVQVLVFEHFYLIKNHDTAGSKMGLSNVKQVVELHKAALSMSTQDSGNELKITICLLMSFN
jgi:signal transduction histidine kinase